MSAVINQGAAEAAPTKKRANNKVVQGFDYIRGVGVHMTVTEWRAVAATHNIEVKGGETFFRGRITKRLEFEAYDDIR